MRYENIKLLVESLENTYHDLERPRTVNYAEWTLLQLVKELVDRVQRLESKVVFLVSERNDE